MNSKIINMKNIKTFESFNADYAKILAAGAGLAASLGVIGYAVYDEFFVDNHILTGEHQTLGFTKYSNINVDIIKHKEVLVNTYTIGSGKSRRTIRTVTIEDPTIKTIWLHSSLFGDVKASKTEVKDGVRVDLNNLDKPIEGTGYKLYNTDLYQTFFGGVNAILVVTGNTTKEELYYPMELDGQKYALLDVQENFLSNYKFVVPVSILAGGELSGAGGGGDF